MGGAVDLRCVVCQVEDRTCALPLEHVVEVMRPQPIEPFERAPRFVLGVSVIRGVPLPVVDAGELLLSSPISLQGPKARFLSLRVGTSGVALAVSGVVGVSEVALADLAPLPSLLAGESTLVHRLGTLDGQLLRVLESARLIEQASPPDDPGEGQ